MAFFGACRSIHAPGFDARISTKSTVECYSGAMASSSETAYLLCRNDSTRANSVLLLNQRGGVGRPCLSDNERQCPKRRALERNSFLMKLGIIALLLQLCSGFTPHLKNTAGTRSVFSSTSGLHAVETEPTPGVRRQTFLGDIEESNEEEVDIQSLPSRQTHSSLHSSSEAESTEADENESCDVPPATEAAELPVIVDDEDDDADDEIEIQRRVAMARAALLGKSPTVRKSTRAAKSTSVGTRRVGSATNARQGVRATSRLMDSIRKTARVATVQGADVKDIVRSHPKAKLNTSLIHSTIEDILKMRRPGLENPTLSSIGRSAMGLLGEATNTKVLPSDDCSCKPLESFPASRSIAVRVATPADYVDIACLRLSVFSDISPEMQCQFRDRSCQAIDNRRLRGATCVVATSNAPSSNESVLLGSAECSFHEFYSTQLGQRRPQNSILYVTEVAVNPVARRRGIGARLLSAIEDLAEQRKAETLYLHVDVTNQGAISLYKKEGYQQVGTDDPMFVEFTTTLNLHPGATRNRDHHLFAKDLKEPTWLPAPLQPATEALGFVVPAYE